MPIARTWRIGHQFQIPTHDVAGEKRKGASGFAVNLSRAAARERTELPGVQERLVNPPGANLEIFFLMDRPGRNDCLRCFLSAGYRQSTKADGATGDHVPPRAGIRLIGHRRPS